MIRVNTFSTVSIPLHEHIASMIRSLIADGVYRTGSTLPSASKFAQQLGSHPNTILRAYRLLAAENIIDLRRSRGAIVMSGVDHDKLNDIIDDLLAEAGRQNLTLGALVAQVSRRASS